MEEVGESMVLAPAAEHGAVGRAGAIGDIKVPEQQLVGAGEAEQVPWRPNKLS